MALTSALVIVASLALHAQVRPVDTERSTLTVFAYKSGLFSAFADDHTIRAPIADGSISDVAPLSVKIAVRSADLVVLDRDYLTVPADQIKDIKPVLTMVGGKIVYDAAAATGTR